MVNVKKLQKATTENLFLDTDHEISEVYKALVYSKLLCLYIGKLAGLDVVKGFESMVPKPDDYCYRLFLEAGQFTSTIRSGCVTDTDIEDAVTEITDFFSYNGYYDTFNCCIEDCNQALEECLAATLPEYHVYTDEDNLSDVLSETKLPLRVRKKVVDQMKYCDVRCFCLGDLRENQNRLLYERMFPEASVDIVRVANKTWLIVSYEDCGYSSGAIEMDLRSYFTFLYEQLGKVVRTNA